jgi:hypothetical protein
MMKEDKGTKGFLECFSNFMGDPEGISREELIAELEEEGINVTQLEERVAGIVKRCSETRRLAWRTRAQQRRTEIEMLLRSKRIAVGTANLKKKIMEILEGHYGQGALSHAEAYFRKKDTLSEEDLESLIEDLEDLNLLEELGTKEE